MVAPCGANKFNRLSLGDQQDVDLKSDSGAGTEPALGGRHLEDCQPRARVQVRSFSWPHHPLLTQVSDRSVELSPLFTTQVVLILFGISSPDQRLICEGHKVILKAFSDEGNQLLNIGRER